MNMNNFSGPRLATEKREFPARLARMGFKGACRVPALWRPTSIYPAFYTPLDRPDLIPWDNLEHVSTSIHETGRDSRTGGM